MIVLALIAGLGACGNDQIDLPDQPLMGEIVGQSWDSNKASAFRFSSDGKYQIKFLSSKESGTDPCTIPSPSQPYLSAIFKPAIRSFSFSTVVADPNQVNVKIHPSFSEEFIITNGFMEIYAIDNSIMFGYIQAISGDETKVEGIFEARFCN